MNLNTTLRMCKTAMVCAFLFGTLFTSTAAFGQNYVNGDQAVFTLKSQIEQVENEAISYYQSGNTEDAVLSGYRYRYAKEMLEQLESGTVVAEAVQISLPTDKFVVSSASTGEEIDSRYSLLQIRTDLKNWADDILTQ